MTEETTNRQVQEFYPESDATTKRSLEGLANSISQFREAVHRIAEQQGEQAAWQSGQIPGQILDQARRRRRSAQRRVMLECAVAMVLCVAMALPGIGYYRHHSARVREQQQAQAQRQREADAALLDQVASEISETVPDSMQPLAEMDADSASDETSAMRTERKNGTRQ